MNAAENPQIEVLFNASARDERTIEFDVPDQIFGFHAQQAIEKLYKALLTARGEKHEFTHDLKALVKHLEALGEQIPALPMGADELSEYAVEFRMHREPQSHQNSALFSGMPFQLCASLRAHG